MSTKAEWVTPEEAARVLGIPQEAILDGINAGRIGAVRSIHAGRFYWLVALSGTTLKPALPDSPADAAIGVSHDEKKLEKLEKHQNIAALRTEIERLKQEIAALHAQDTAKVKIASLERESSELRNLVALIKSRLDDMLKVKNPAIREDLRRRFPRAFTLDLD